MLNKNKNTPCRRFPSEHSVIREIRDIFTGRINLICIDDSPQICSLLCDDIFRSPIMKKRMVHSFDCARSAIAGKTPYHLWILDITLDRPNDGLELLKLKPGFPFSVVVSGAQSMSAATDALKAGVYSAYDKNEIFWSNPHKFVREACALAALSFMLNLTILDRFAMFDLLINKRIHTPEEWSLHFCRNERTIRDTCADFSGLTAKQFLSFFHALNAAILSECLLVRFSGYDEIMEDLILHEHFYEECGAYVLAHLDIIYGPRYLQRTHDAPLVWAEPKELYHSYR
jgi:hypothetical protein